MKDDDSQRGIEAARNQHIVGVSSLTDPDFDYEQFWTVEQELNPRPDESLIHHVREGRLTFSDNGHGYIFFALKDESDDAYRAVAYFKSYKLTDYLVLLPSDGGFKITPLREIISDALGLEIEAGAFIIEYGGIVVKPQYRGQGYAGKLQEFMLQEVTRSIANDHLSFFDADTAHTINPHEVSTVLVAHGELDTNSAWNRVRTEVIPVVPFITFGELELSGVNPNAVGKVRDQSRGTRSIAQNQGMTYVGVNPTDGGPIFAERLF